MACPVLAGEPTPEQLKLLQQLPPAERKALIDRYASGAGEGATVAGEENRNPLTAPVEPARKDAVDPLQDLKQRAAFRA